LGLVSAPVVGPDFQILTLAYTELAVLALEYDVPVVTLEPFVTAVVEAFYFTEQFGDLLGQHFFETFKYFCLLGFSELFTVV